MAQNKYITQAELAESFDTRTLAELASDDGTPATVGSDTNIDNAIERASARVEESCQQGGRYTADDLADLQTADDWSLKGLVADLAVHEMYVRRGPPPDRLKERFDAAQKRLDDLGAGKTVFKSDSAIAAGRASIRVVTDTERHELRRVSDEPYFPVRRGRVV